MTSRDEFEAEGGYRYRLAEGGGIETRWAQVPWSPVSMQLVREAYPAGHAIWLWLRERGIKRPGKSGPSGANRQSKAVDDALGRAKVTVRLGPDEVAVVDALAERWSTTRASALVRAATEAFQRKK